MGATATRKPSFPFKTTQSSAKKKTNARVNVKQLFTPPEPVETEEKKIQVNGMVSLDVSNQWHQQRKKIKVPKKTGGGKELNATRAIEISLKLFILLGDGDLSLSPDQAKWIEASFADSDTKKDQVYGRVWPEISDKWHEQRKKIMILRVTKNGEKELNPSKAMEISLKLFILLSKGELTPTEKQTAWIQTSLE